MEKTVKKAPFVPAHVLKLKIEVSPEQFVRTWCLSSSIKEVSKTLHMPISAVLARASSYKRKGVKLKEMESN